MSNDLTVIVPTYNRLSALRLCLRALENQTRKYFNVIIVNDGSTDGTAEALSEIQRTSPLFLQVLHQENSGPARARNLALTHVSTPFSLLIGDDILPEPDCLEVHRNFHMTHPANADVAVGWTKWDLLHQQVTPFMQWYEEIQFDYQNLHAGRSPDWRHFYTSNLSFKTHLFRDNPFDERFRAAAWEDIELGFRLMISSKARITFVPTACATHLHPTTFPQAARRMQTLGRNQRLFHDLWPSARLPEETDWKSQLCTSLGKRAELLEALTVLLERNKRWLKPSKLHAMILRSHQQQGYLERA